LPPCPAAQLVNALSEAELGRIIREYGEERSWRAVARRVVAAREQQPITSTRQLAEAVGQTVFRGRGGGGGGRKGGGRGIHPATRTFQALRIAVNDEISRLERVRGGGGERPARAPGGGGRRGTERPAAAARAQLQARPARGLPGPARQRPACAG
jgi:16S rRNA (cytosine1402-N4)-methyltransferase